MKRITTCGLCGTAFLLAASVPAFAQTSSSAGNLTTAKTDTATSSSATTSSTTVIRKPRATATPEMVNEAIQRSEARAAKEAATGIPQKWGSEEPFTYNPAVRRFNANQQ